MKTSRTIGIFLVTNLLCAFIGGCTKSQEKASSNDIVLLRDKSLPEIKKIITGNWKIHYSYAGLTGRYKREFSNYYCKFLSNDNMYLTYNDTLYVADKAGFVRKKTEFGYSAWLIQFSRLNSLGDEWIVDYQVGDTLVLQHNAPDSYGYHMSKVP